MIEKAKAYARREGRSLSNLIETYLRSLTLERADSLELSPIAKLLYGAVQVEAAAELDYDAILADELTKEHLQND